MVTGVLEADGKGAAALQLDNMGLLPISVTEVKDTSTAASQDLFARFRRVKTEDLIFFTRQLQTIIRSGIPINTGLKALEEQAESHLFKTALSIITEDIDRGQKFSDSLAVHPKIFSETYVSMVRAGEESGTLEEVLERLATLIEFQMKTKEMLKAALRYPMIVFSTLIGAFIVLVQFVIPKFAGVFLAAKMELPLPTRILLLINDVSQRYGVFIFFGIVLLIIALVMYYRTPDGKLRIDEAKLKVPIIGPIILKIAMARFANMFENLVKSGVSVVYALEVISRTVGNEFVARKIMDIADKIEKGRGLTRPLREARVFPPLVIRLIATGEETGSLEEMLREISSHYDMEVGYSVSRLSTWIEPIITISLASMVLFMALAMFMPYWDMMSTIKGGG